MRRVSSTLTAIVLALLSLGIVMLASTSSVRGEASFQDPQFFLKRQATWLAFSILAAFILYRFDYHWWQKVGYPMAVVAVVLLVVVVVPPFRHRINGSYRWLNLGIVNIQPSEIAKFAVVVAMSLWMARMGRRANRWKEGFLLPLCGLGTVSVLILMEPDFGTTVLTFMTGIAILCVGGARLSYVFGLAGLGVGGIVLMVLQDPVRLIRVLAFLWPDKYPAATYHVMQSKLAFMAGGMWGVGLGNSIQKQLYLPEAHTDFILAIVGEELGFIATMGVIVLFVGILICGIAISMKAPDPFGRYLAFGLTVMIVLQAAINVGVVTGCLPTKGLPLPFISYGGSSLLVSLASVAVLLNVARHCADTGGDEHTMTIKDRGHDW